jgi:hypothetical protein
MLAVNGAALLLAVYGSWQQRWPSTVLPLLPQH